MSRDFVIDASVVVKWYLTDEEAADKAASLLISFMQGEFRFHAPSLIVYQVGRAIHRGYRQRRISIDAATRSLSDLADLNLQLFDEPEIIAGAYRIAKSYRCNFDDACYLALAELLGLPFVFADDKLERQLAGRVDYALPLARLDLAHCRTADSPERRHRPHQRHRTRPGVRPAVS